MNSVGIELPKEIARVHKLKESYEAIGPTGAFGLSFIRPALERAEKANAEQDAAQMCVCLAELQEMEK